MSSLFQAKNWCWGQCNCKSIYLKMQVEKFCQICVFKWGGKEIRERHHGYLCFWREWRWESIRNWKDMFISRTWQGLKLCIWKTLISANSLQLNWLLLDFIIICLWHVSTSLVLGYKRFWFCFPNVSPPGGVLAKYLIMGYQVIYNEYYYYNTLWMDIQWEANDCITPNATADLNERVDGQDRDHIKKHW